MITIVTHLKGTNLATLASNLCKEASLSLTKLIIGDGMTLREFDL